MKELIETIVKPLVDFPEDVRIDIVEDNDRMTYKLNVNKTDMGKVIGKQGKVAKAIRTVVYAAGASQQKKIYLEICE
ncbi:KH domain-containing protein [Bacillus sp. 31A1R]|uniref:RNA-binding protein KhpA n=1 Tax=Robertmurraya mangrovi TaxID=3098077 RepID=A0ABU5J4L6_9BACI|nr:KH domain-containing protein [Bacillus sp. 31A1R]MDZ5474366.1 KH domain-containing protein [Bacillus sp. 31A1R]